MKPITDCKQQEQDYRQKRSACNVSYRHKRSGPYMCLCIRFFYNLSFPYKSFHIGSMIEKPLNKRVVQVYRQPIALILKSDLIKYQLIDWQFQWFESKHFCLWFDLTSQWKCFATYKYGGWSDNLIERKIFLKSFERPSCSVVLSTYYLLPYITKSLSISTWVNQADKSLKLLLQQPLPHVYRNKLKFN